MIIRKNARPWWSRGQELTCNKVVAIGVLKTWKYNWLETINVINEKNESCHAHELKEICTHGFDELDDFTSITIIFQSSL
jgi:hypothetical protein